MQASEEKIEDVRGRYRYVDSDGATDDAGWTDARFVITSERLIVFDADGTKESVPLTSVAAIDAPGALGVADPVADATALALEETVLVIVTQFRRAFEAYLQQAALDRRTVYIAEGAAPDEDAWLHARLFVAQRRLQLAATDGEQRVVDPDAIHELTTTTATIDGEEFHDNRIVHGPDGRVTHLAVSETAQPFLEHFLAGSDR